MALIAFSSGLIVGRLWAPPLAVAAWVVFITLHDESRGVGNLEPGIVHWLMLITSLSAFGAAAAGVLIRVVLRRVAAPPRSA
jgi:hypothetical protein